MDAGVQVLAFSATFPPSLRSETLEELGITDFHLIHAPTDRPEISYSVKLYKTRDQAKQQLISILNKRMDQKKDVPSFRAIVYCRSTANVEELAAEIGCKPFHAGRPEAERAKTFKDWVSGKHRVVVSTSLLGCGIDVEGVEVVLHLETPWSVSDFSQESGRAGRGGHPSMSIIFASEDEREPDGEDVYGKATMRRFVLGRSECRRATLSAFLDGGNTTCVSLPKALLCDVCLRESKNPHPGRLVLRSPPVVPNSGIPRPKKPPQVPPTSARYDRDRAQHQPIQR